MKRNKHFYVMGTLILNDQLVLLIKPFEVIVYDQF